MGWSVRAAGLCQGRLWPSWMNPEELCWTEPHPADTALLCGAPLALILPPLLLSLSLALSLFYTVPLSLFSQV